MERDLLVIYKDTIGDIMKAKGKYKLEKELTLINLLIGLNFSGVVLWLETTALCRSLLR